MERLVKNILNLSALEISETVKSEVVDLTNLIESLLEDYRLFAGGRNIRIDVHIPKNLTINGDPEKLIRAFSNILDNAVKYNQEGGWIGLEARDADGDVNLKLINTGAGIPASDLDKSI